MIEREYQDVVQRLNYVFVNSLGLHLHLCGLKDYLLLNKGDFVQVLLENVAPVLIRPANLLYRHDLTSKLETAVRSSNAYHDSAEVLKCVDARMLELGHGDIGWDVFTLDYRLEGALKNVILDPESRTEYLRVFNFLWRVRRVSYILGQSWRELRPTSHINNDNTSDIRISARSSCTSMTHFISELHYYITYEVISTSWIQMEKELSSHLSTVDDIKAVHKRYLERIKQKGLLGGGGKLMSELHGILKDIVVFGEVTNSIEEVELANDEQRTARVTETIYRVKRGFERRVERLVMELGKFEDEELRFLGIRFDFNGYYTRAKEARDQRDRADRLRSEEARNERKRKEGAV
ncbi:hypothetical protein NADFUDRAFT_83878 [Nadsonia fulvescens var. elongata DSM 6958]|uniref:Gamma tubulin complex component C-terminal domain-containing protein n=1 Tax=Nadsonia fulvescens var. elongata DSM 6958 TaxID=857566 RepID=A0A1E3PG62_9ASCO|nr:hypothetical protein NADFUDRAFT_83878 [Nadsonia fulvescens var. elongata DSM 6958]